MRDRYPDYAKLEQLKKMEDQLRLQEELPHIYGHKLYTWQREFLETRNPMVLLTAANQIGKSSINIKKIITLSTSPSLWPVWWPKLHGLKQIPRQMWYLYPDSKVATTEFHEKWVPEFLPRGKTKESHPLYGWKANFANKLVQSLHFVSGVSIYFKSYSQNAQSLQGGTVSYIACDEELPFELYDELKFRLSHTDGYYANVFTCTLNQEEWRCAMEEVGTRLEKFPNAWKRQISLYDCIKYEDGTPSNWTRERIEKRKADCGSEAEVDRRIYGRFVRSQNRKYVFDPGKNQMEPRDLPKDWHIYSGVDIGTGGRDNHPAAIIFVGVSEDFSEGEVFLGWRGDGVQTTTGDILTKYLEMREPFDRRVVEARYDYHAKDFAIIASRIGETFLMANKKRDEGEDILNTLFKHGALRIHETGELKKLCTELRNLVNDIDKRKAVDDFCFVAGTKVAVSNGVKNIENIQIGDLVFTSGGYRPVEVISQREDDIMELIFSNGTFLKCTLEHPFFTKNRGWIPARLLTLSDTLLTIDECKKLKQSFTRVLNLEDIPSLKEIITEITIPQVVSILMMELRHSIGKFGKNILGQSQKEWLYTIRMGILQIIELKIWNFCQGPIINPFMQGPRIGCNNLGKILELPERRPGIGMVPKRDWSFIKNWEYRVGRIGLILKSLAKYVALSMRPEIAKEPLDSALINVEHLPGDYLIKILSNEHVSFVGKVSLLINIVKQKLVQKNVRVISSKSIITKEKVYNLKVQDIPEYFANGILTHNCDALRYAVVGIPWNLEKIKKDKPLVVRKELSEIDLRRLEFDDTKEHEEDLYNELAYWNEMMGN